MDVSTMRHRAASARAGRLATVRPDGRPHIVVCCFALSGDRAYSAVDEKPKTTRWLQRLRNVAARPDASLLVDHYDEDWSALWWIRIDGTGRVLDGDGEHRLALSLLSSKYEQYRRQPPTGPVLALDIVGWTAWSASTSRSVSHGAGDELVGTGIEDPIVAEAGDGPGERRHDA